MIAHRTVDDICSTEGVEYSARNCTVFAVVLLLLGVAIGATATADWFLKGLFVPHWIGLVLHSTGALILVAVGVYLLGAGPWKRLYVSRDQVRETVWSRTRSIRFQDLRGASWVGHRDGGGTLWLWSNDCELTVVFSEFRPAERSKLVDFFWPRLNERFPNRATSCFGTTSFGRRREPSRFLRLLIRIELPLAPLAMGLFCAYADWLLPGARPSPGAAVWWFIVAACALCLVLRPRNPKVDTPGREPE